MLELTSLKEAFSSRGFSKISGSQSILRLLACRSTFWFRLVCTSAVGDLEDEGHRDSLKVSDDPLEANDNHNDIQL